MRFAGINPFAADQEFAILHRQATVLERRGLTHAVPSHASVLNAMLRESGAECSHVRGLAVSSQGLVAFPQFAELKSIGRSEIGSEGIVDASPLLLRFDHHSSHQTGYGLRIIRVYVEVTKNRNEAHATDGNGGGVVKQRDQEP